MKKFKKFFAVLLTLAMVLGMSMTTFAAEKKVVVNGLKDGTEVSYVKIIEPDNESSDGWKMATTTNVGMSLEQILKAVNKGEDGKINPSLAELNFSNLVPDSDVKTAANGKVTFNNMAPGLYAIKANDKSGEFVYSWMVAYVGYDAEDTVNVTAKGASNQVTKTVVDTDNKSVAVGEELQYNVNVKYPYFAENKEGKGFEIVDTVENGEFVSIAAESRAALEKLGFTVPSDADLAGKKEMKITLDMSKYDAEKAGSDVSITYTVKAGNVSATDSLQNTVSSTVKTGSEEEDKTTTESKVILPSFDVNVSKTDAEGTAITNSVATFQLYVEATDGTDMDVYNPETKQTETKKLKAVGNAVNTVNGVAVFTGLDAEGKYYVKETVAPDGYALEELAYPLTGAEAAKTKDGVIENGVKVTEYTKTSDFDSVGFGDGLNFHDTEVGSLPSTGGIGTTIFTIGGCAIMIIAAGLFFASRRRSAK